MPEKILQFYPVLSGSGVLSQSILDIFVLQDILDYEDAEKLKSHFRTNREIEDFLVKNRLVGRDTINKAYSILLKIPYIGLASVAIPDEVKKIISKQIANKYGVIPFNIDGRIVRIALSKPADLLLGYMKTLVKIFENKNLALELFITGESDFKEAVKQYDKKKSDQPLLKKGSLPVIYLRNLKITPNLLTKIPKEYIAKYRIIIFAENVYGGFMIACQEPDSFLTKKVLSYIEKENNIKLEVFAASKDDFDHVLTNYDDFLKGTNVELAVKEETPLPENPVIQKTEQVETKKPSVFSLENLFGPEKKNSGSEVVIDSVTSPDEEKVEKVAEKQDEIIEKNKLKQYDEKMSPVKGDYSADELKKKNEKEFGKGALISEDEADSVNLKNTKEDRGETSAVQSKLFIPQNKTNKASANFTHEGSEESDLGSLLNKEITSAEMMQGIINEGYVPKIVAGLINYCLNQKVSDVHIEPQVKTLRVRSRIDGVLTDIAKIDLSLHPPIISRVKILSKLKLDESRIPQDGRFDVSFKDREVDVRVSTMPTVHGEKVVLRILDKTQKMLSLEDLGLLGSAFDKTLTAIAKPWGIILSTGPTGSGKSTTLNAIISRLNKPGINIITLEDPVEYETPGVNQCQIRPEIGFTFASGLRSILRQDPNIIMVGEIRDGETASMTTQSALTGHLVLSTLHTNDTAGALPRLINMGIEPFLITSSIQLVLAQRLIRLICPKCKEELKVPPNLIEEVKKELDLIPATNKKERDRIPAEYKFYYGRGCSECNQGYRGRLGLFEAMEMTPAIENLAIGRKAANEMKAQAIKDGMITMKQDGLLKVLAGMTTLDEVFTATSQDK